MIRWKRLINKVTFFSLKMVSNRGAILHIFWQLKVRFRPVLLGNVMLWTLNWTNGPVQPYPWTFGLNLGSVLPGSGSNFGSGPNRGITTRELFKCLNPVGRWCTHSDILCWTSLGWKEWGQLVVKWLTVLALDWEWELLRVCWWWWIALEIAYFPVFRCPW